MRRLTLAELEERRARPGESLLLFLTDRCPVGCGHCSVDSRADSPTISDFARFASIVDGICAEPALRTVGISGGEPFVERRGLTLAVERLTAAAKEIVIYTSGVWAGSVTPAWIPPVLAQANAVVLSTDAFHTPGVAGERFVRAARTIAAQDVWLIIQVLNDPATLAMTEQLLATAFGPTWEHFAEFSIVPLLPYGRAAAGAAARPRFPGATFPACDRLRAPVVRYDGVISACCNERVAMGWGPERLRRQGNSAAAVTDALASFRADPLLNVIAGAGAGVLTAHPRYAVLAEAEFASICDLCWAINDRAPALEDQGDLLITAMALLRQETTV